MLIQKKGVPLQPKSTKDDDFVAQLVEQLTLNQWVESSNLSEITRNNEWKFFFELPFFYSPPLQFQKVPPQQWNETQSIRFYADWHKTAY